MNPQNLIHTKGPISVGLLGAQGCPDNVSSAERGLCPFVTGPLSHQVLKCVPSQFWGDFKAVNHCLTGWGGPTSNL